MNAMRLSGGQPQPEFPAPAYAREDVEERLEHWRRVLVDSRRKSTNVVMPREEIVRTLDRWLDELIELKGR